MIREEFFPTSVFGKDIKLDNNKLAQDIVNWSNQDQGLQKTLSLQNIQLVVFMIGIWIVM